MEERREGGGREERGEVRKEWDRKGEGMKEGGMKQGREMKEGREVERGKERVSTINFVHACVCHA